MRIGFFGGTFDPPHRGHLELARLARERLALDRVLIAPVGSQPLKHGIAAASFEDRVAMTRLAYADEPCTEISLIDAPWPDGRPNYTIETMQKLEESGQPEDRYFCIMGADSFLSITKWHRAADLLMNCALIVGARPGFDLSHLTAALPQGISVASEDHQSGLILVGLSDTVGRQGSLYLLTDLDIDLSATAIREAIGKGKTYGPTKGDILSSAVLDYICSHSLYQDS